MTQIHVVIRRVNPALKIDLVQVGCLKDGQFDSLPLAAVRDLPISNFLKHSDISESFYIDHSEIPTLVSDSSYLPKFGLEFFDNTFVITFDYNLNCDESTTKENKKGD